MLQKIYIRSYVSSQKENPFESLGFRVAWTQTWGSRLKARRWHPNWPFCCSGIGNPFPGGGPSPPQADELELWARGEALLWTHHIRAARVTGCLAYTGVPNKMLYLYQYLFFRQWKEPWLMVILRKSTAIICMIVAISISTKANVALFL